MILFEASSAAVVRPGELEIAGRRVVARAVPFVGPVWNSSYAFDPVELRFHRPAPPQRAIAAGPPDGDEWRHAIVRLPGGPLLIGPGSSPGEAVWGSYSAAAEGARASGRAAYLLDPPAVAIPRPKGGEYVVLETWRCDGSIDSTALETADRAGVPAGCLLPLIPGWTRARDAIDELVRGYASSGARFVAPLTPLADGIARRLIVDARGELSIGPPDDFFERVHHGDWERELAAGRQALADACARAGLATVIPRPTGLGEPAANSAAAALLEDRARELSRDEHRATLLHAAARWIDESGRDLSRVAREGNFRRVFPFGAELALEAEHALLGREV